MECPDLVAWPYGKDKPSSEFQCLSLDECLRLEDNQLVAAMKIVCSRKMTKKADAVFRQMNLTTERLFPDKSFECIRDIIKRRLGQR